MMSPSFNGINLGTDNGLQILFLIVKNFLSTNFWTNVDIGAVIKRLPVPNLLPFLISNSLLFELVLFICTPRNLALSALAFVMRVFSIDKVRLRLSKKV